MARPTQVHVVWIKKGNSAPSWHIKTKGKYLTTCGYERKQEAVVWAKSYAKSSRGELVIQNKNGRISRKHSYGNDPRHIKG